MMKTSGATTIVRLMISIFLIAITSSGVVVGQNAAVLDRFGRPVRANARYRITILRGNAFRRSAFITQQITGTRQNPSCARQVKVTTRVSTATRIPPVEFLSSSDVVRVDTELNIRFVPTVCPDSFWKVEAETGAVVLSRSLSSTDSTFIIRPSGQFYNLAFGSAISATNIGTLNSGNGILGLLSGQNSIQVFFDPI